jgi:hypothetical protein
MSADKQPTPPVESPTAAWLGNVPDARSLAEVGETTAGLPGTPEAIGSAVAVPPELAQHPRYRVLALLGEGGMGAVYKAQHTHMDRVVALKVIRPSLVKHPVSLKRFEQEVRAAARLTHANIVTAYDADRAGSLHYRPPRTPPSASGMSNPGRSCTVIEDTSARRTVPFSPRMVDTFCPPATRAFCVCGRYRRTFGTNGSRRTRNRKRHRSNLGGSI